MFVIKNLILEYESSSDDDNEILLLEEDYDIIDYDDEQKKFI